MIKIRSRLILIYALALLIPFLYFINLDWNATSFVNSHESMNIYFGADVARVVDNLEDNAATSHYRDKVHPYFSLIAVSVAKIGVYFGYTNYAFPIYRLIFGTLGVFLFWLFIYKNTNTFQAYASLALLFSSMSFRVWSAIPETFLFSFFTLMCALNLMRLKLKPEFILLATLAGTVTNLVLGLLHLILTHINKQLIFKITLSFFFMAIAASIIQQSIYPTSIFFFDLLSHKEELNYIAKDFGVDEFRLFDFFISGFIVPLNNEISLPITTANLWQRFYTVDLMASKKMTLLTISTITILVAAYLTSLFAFFKQFDKNTISLSILYFIVFELVLHLFYGDAPFLYSLNFTPLIIVFMSLNQPEKMKSFAPYCFIFLALLIQRFNFFEPKLFAKYFF